MSHSYSNGFLFKGAILIQTTTIGEPSQRKEVTGTESYLDHSLLLPLPLPGLCELLCSAACFPPQWTDTSETIVQIKQSFSLRCLCHISLVKATQKQKYTIFESLYSSIFFLFSKLLFEPMHHFSFRVFFLLFFSCHLFFVQF